jgi:hypothetical protein
MDHKLKRTIERINVFRNAWEKNAADDKFAGMSLAEFTEATKLPGELAGEILEIRREAQRKQVNALNTLEPVNRLLELVAHSVQGTPGFGPDSALFEELGYIRKSDRKTGLTRKKTPVEKPANEVSSTSPSTNAA